MPNPVGLEDVSARYPGVLTAQQQINATAWLSDVWSMVLQDRPTIEDDITANTVSVADVKRVVAEAVVRKLLNPERKSREAIDDYSFNREEGMGNLYLTDDELDDLTPPVDSSVTATRGSVRLVAYGES